MHQPGAGRVALITGASSGFGREAALRMARRGFRVFATVRGEAKAAALRAAAREAGVDLEVAFLELTDDDQRRAVVARVLDEAGRLDVLVNNAGYGLAGFVEDVTLDELRRQFETNFFGTVALTKLVLPHMRERRSGSIIVVSSMAGVVASPAVSAYVSSKFALEGYFEALDYELAPFDVNVSLVEPGQYPTPVFTTGLVLAKNSELPTSPYYRIGSLILSLVEKRVASLDCDPAEVADLIVRIALEKRPRCRYAIGTDARVARALQAVLPESLFRGTLRIGMKLAYERLENGRAEEPPAWARSSRNPPPSVADLGA